MERQAFPAAVLYPAPTTPIGPDDRFDRSAFAEHLTWLEQTGVDGVVVCGTTGEFIALDDDERIDAFRVALDVFGPGRVIAHVGAATLRSALALTDRAVRLGVRRVLAITPYYQPAGPGSVQDYYARIAERVDGDVFAYLFASRSANVVTPGQLADIGRTASLAGAKVSGESGSTVLEFKAAFPDGQILCGNDAAIEQIVLGGADGGVSGVASTFPEVFVALRDALRTGDLAAAHAAQQKACIAIDALPGGSPRLLKLGLDLRGLRGGKTRLAEDEPSPDQVAMLRAAIAATC